MLSAVPSEQHITENNAADFEVIDVCDSINTTESTETSSTVCVYKQNSFNDYSMLKCVFVDCPFGRYFHILYLGYKRIPKSDDWLYFSCRKEEAKKKRNCIL